MNLRSTKILVCDACRGAAVATIRSLARGGYEVVAGDSHARSPGLASRYAAHRVVYACPTADPDQFVEDILAAVKRFEIDMIFPITEQSVLPLENRRDRIEAVCRVPWAPVESAGTVREKKRTFELAEKLGVPYPRTALVHTIEQALKMGPDLGWPLVLKPNSSHTLAEKEGVQVWSVSYAQDERDLQQKMKVYEGKCPVLLQEYFQGAGVGVELLVHEGEPISAFQHRRLREVPLTGGASSLRRSEALDPQLYSYTLELVRALKWTGLAMAEFKKNEQGEARLMEINGRAWGSLPVAIAAGVDFPSGLCELVLQGPPDRPFPPPAQYRTDVHVQNFQKELSWILRVLRGRSEHPLMAIPRRTKTVGAIIDLMRPSYRFDVLSLRDPMPGIRILSNIIRTAGQSVLTKIPSPIGRARKKDGGKAITVDLVDAQQNMASRAK